VIARFATDAAWPGPVWGVGQRKDYAAPQAMVLAGRLRRELGCA
jgi:diadenosine tetraphosphate (Ap4A) HIT family hydrolase